MKLRLSYFVAHHEKTGFPGKVNNNNTGKGGRQKEKRKTKYSGAPHSDVNPFWINRRYEETLLNGTENAIGTH